LVGGFVKNILRFFLVVSIFLTPFFVFASEKPARNHKILSYADWKQEKVHVASEQVSATKNKLHNLRARAKGYKDPQIAGIRQQLNQHEFNLEVAKDLGVVDYIVLYLSTKDSAEGLKLAAMKMSAKETAQLLKAYLNAIKPGEEQGTTGLKLPRYSNEKSEQ